MARLDVKLADGSDAWIEVDDGRVDQELQNFIDHRGRFTQDWIQVEGSGSRTAKYVRYDQIVQVSAKVM